MMVGPVEYLVVGFPGNRFTGDIAPELARLIDSGTIRILDLTFIGKDEDGAVVSFEFDQLDELEPFAVMEGDVGGVISDEDIQHAASMLEPGSSAALSGVGGPVGDPLCRCGREGRWCDDRECADPQAADRGSRLVVLPHMVIVRRMTVCRAQREMTTC